MSRKPSAIENYEQYRPHMKTGDLIAFSGNAGFSNVIKWATKSPYSHVGIVLKADLSSGFGDSILAIESTLQTSELDANNKQAIKGIQMHWLSKRIELYNGAVYWQQLKNPMSPEKEAEMSAWLRETHNKKVPYDRLQIYNAAIDWFDELGLSNQPDFSTIFCSELVAKALQIGGVLDPNLNPSEQTPDDVVKFPCFAEPLLLKPMDFGQQKESPGIWELIRRFFGSIFASSQPETQPETEPFPVANQPAIPDRPSVSEQTPVTEPSEANITTRIASNLENYEQYRAQMQTGDLIAFSGNAGFSNVIKWATKSPYSHVGIVLKANMGSGFGDSVLIIESTLETRVLDANNKQAIKGIQMHWLSKRIELYPGSVYWLGLKTPATPEKQAEMEAWLRETHNKKVRYDYLQIYNAAIDWFDELGLSNQPEFSTLFCSELVAKALQIAGLVDPGINASEQTPDDVVKLPCFQEPVVLKA